MSNTDYYTVDHATDEWDQDRYFVADPDGNWISGPYDTKDQADEKANDLNKRGKP